MSEFKRFIKTIPDFPVKGIKYRDIQPLLADERAFEDAINAMTEMIKVPYEDIDSVILKLYGEGLKKVDDDYIVKEDVRRLVTFQHGNFYDGVPDAGPFDVMVFRQHLQFWEPYQQEVIIENLSQALKPAGNLILANDESLLGLSSDFVPVYNVPGFYRKVA